MEHFEGLSEACFGGSLGGLFWEFYCITPIAGVETTTPHACVRVAYVDAGREVGHGWMRVVAAGWSMGSVKVVVSGHSPKIFEKSITSPN